jgi:hypothetical protein
VSISGVWPSSSIETRKDREQGNKGKREQEDREQGIEKKGTRDVGTGKGNFRDQKTVDPDP